MGPDAVIVAVVYETCGYADHTPGVSVARESDAYRDFILIFFFLKIVSNSSELPKLESPILVRFLKAVMGHCTQILFISNTYIHVIGCPNTLEAAKT